MSTHPIHTQKKKGKHEQGAVTVINYSVRLWLAKVPVSLKRNLDAAAAKIELRAVEQSHCLSIDLGHVVWVALDD